jgi:hypothetical protein
LTLTFMPSTLTFLPARPFCVLSSFSFVVLYDFKGFWSKGRGYDGDFSLTRRTLQCSGQMSRTKIEQ